MVGDRAITGSAASASQMGRFETKWLSRPENLAALAELPGQWIDKVHQQRPPKMIVLVMDSSESPTYGEQEGSAYNSHFGCTCYHPLFVFNQFGDVERCALRAGNVHSAAEWRAVLEPVVARYREIAKRLYCRADAAFANPEMYEFLEAEGIGYTIRLPANSILQRRIGYLLKRPVRRPPHEVRRYYASFRYQAQSWSKPRRVVAKVEWHPGELYARVGSIVTNLARPAERVVAFYNQRGTAEQWIREGKGAIKWTRLSCRTFAANAVRLQLHVLAYNLGNFLRTLAMPKAAEPWSLTSLREKLIKIGAKVVSHGALRHVPVGRGRGIAPDVRRHPVAGRPTAGTACASMSGQREQSRRGSEERYASVRAEQRGWALPCRHRRLRSPVADAGRDLPLPKPYRGAILPSKPPEIWRMSVQVGNGHGGVSFCASAARKRSAKSQSTLRSEVVNLKQRPRGDAADRRPIMPVARRGSACD